MHEGLFLPAASFVGTMSRQTQYVVLNSSHEITVVVGVARGYRWSPSPGVERKPVYRSSAV